MKISLKQANELLKPILDVEVVEDDKADKDVDIEAISETLKTTIAEEVRPDIEAEAKADGVKAEFGRLMGSVRSAAAKAFGIKTADLSDKELKDIFTHGLGEYDKRKGANNADWEAERQQLIEAHEAEMERVVLEKETEITAANAKFAERDIMDAAMKVTEKIPRKAGELSEHAEYLLYAAKKQYDVKYNADKKKLEFYEKGTDTLAKINGKAVEADTYSKTVFEKVGIIETDTRNIKAADVRDGKETPASVMDQPDPNKQVFAPNAQAIYAQLDEIEG